MGATMRRPNPDVERLERECASLRRIIDEMRREPGDLPVTGCGDNSCVVRRPTGMATNGGCSCEASELRRALRFYRRLSEFRAETIRQALGELKRG